METLEGDELISWGRFTDGFETGTVAATGLYYLMLVSRMTLKRVLISDSMCGSIMERIHGGRRRLVQEQIVLNLGSGMVLVM